MVENGMVQKWIRDHWPKEQLRCDKSLTSVGNSPATLIETTGAYAVLVIGVVSAIAAFIIELLLTKYFIIFFNYNDNFK